MHWCISEPSSNAKGQKKLYHRSVFGQGELWNLALPLGGVPDSQSEHPHNSPHVSSTPPHHQSGPPTPSSDPPWSSPSHHPPSAWEVPWSPGMGRSLWPTETSRTGRPRKKSALRGLKIRCGLWEIMTIPSLTACSTNCKAHLPDPGFSL